MDCANVGPVEDLLGQPVADLVGGGLLSTWLQPLRQVHHLLDTGGTCGGGESRGGFEQALLHRIREVGPADTAHRGRDRPEVVQVAVDDFGAERAKPIGSVIESVDEGAHGVTPIQQYACDMETCRALDAPRGPSDENGRSSHDVVLSSRTAQVTGVAKSVIPTGVGANSGTLQPYGMTTPFDAVGEPGPMVSSVKNLTPLDKQVNHQRLKLV